MLIDLITRCHEAVNPYGWSVERALFEGPSGLVFNTNGAIVSALHIIGDRIQFHAADRCASLSSPESLGKYIESTYYAQRRS